MRAIRIHEAERLDMADELREAKRIARRDLVGEDRPRKADIARIVGLLLCDERGPHGDGFVAGPSELV